jgi:hypothetical protein
MPDFEIAQASMRAFGRHLAEEAWRRYTGRPLLDAARDESVDELLQAVTNLQRMGFSEDEFLLLATAAEDAFEGMLRELEAWQMASVD